MAKKPMKPMEEMDDDSTEMDDTSEPDDEKPVKKSKGGMVKRYSKIARPQKFSGIF